MRRYLASIALPLVLLVGCGSQGPDGTDPSETYPTQVPVPNQDDVLCIIYDDQDYEQGGISCNWPEPTDSPSPTPTEEW